MMISVMAATHFFVTRYGRTFSHVTTFIMLMEGTLVFWRAVCLAPMQDTVPTRIVKVINATSDALLSYTARFDSGKPTDAQLCVASCLLQLWISDFEAQYSRNSGLHMMPRPGLIGKAGPFVAALEFATGAASRILGALLL